LHHAQLHAATHEPTEADQIDIVLNSQKWNGQTLLLTDPSALQVLKYNSVTFRWENYDNVPAAHATSHKSGQSDEIDIVLNSQKWNGQTILLTDPANGQILRYVSGDLRWENFDLIPDAHATSHEPSGSDEMDLVKNSQKWNGQTILLTGVTNGQILRYVSGDLRWENFDLIPDDHAASHHVGGGDLVDHNSLTNYAANRHVVLPGTIANVLSDHTKAVHDSLLITILGSGALAKDHGAAATDMLVNVCYGTGSPPAAGDTTIGTLFFKYTA